MRSWLLQIALLLWIPAVLFAGEATALPDSVSKKESVPLPRQTAYTGEGLSFGFGGGVFAPQKECDCLGTWQVQMEYFYLSWLSSGGSVRYFGGNIDSDFMLMYQRYNVNLRLHGTGEGLDLFLSPYLGLETTSISEIRTQVSGEDVETMSHWWNHDGKDRAKRDSREDEFAKDAEEVEKEADFCESLFALDGFSVGLEVGFGVNVSRYVGMTGSVSVEYNFSDALMVTTSPGLAFNLREAWPWAKRMLRSTWISFEYGFQMYHNDDVSGWSNVFILGVQFGA